MLDDRRPNLMLSDEQIEALLGREVVRFDPGEARRHMAGKTVLITGAGGSIGAELARHVLNLEPRRLVLVERAEAALFEIDRELRALRPAADLRAALADAGDEDRMRAVFRVEAPQILLHAAAHKHVPLAEANPTEAVRNNLFATRTLARLSGEYAAESFVLVSTDKAVRPKSVMGASKRLAELVIQDFDRIYDTRFAAVRFGNVIGSAGSVVPLVQDQIARGGPVTVTHPAMTRYFMATSEAAQLVLQAGAMSTGGEIFVLDMGAPVSVLDLVRELIRRSGRAPSDDIKIEFTGIRPGEKLMEELFAESERAVRTAHPKILLAEGDRPDATRLRAALDELASHVAAGREQQLRLALNRILPEARLTNHPASGVPMRDDR